MYEPQCLFYNLGKHIKKKVDVCLHGHGFDYAFHGMYLPRKKLKLINKKFDLLIPVKIKNVVEYFLNNISYKTKGANIFGFVNGKSDSKVSIMHLDIDDLTSRRQNNSPYEIS